MVTDNKRIAIIGMGYVGTPLAIAFSKRFLTFGFDINHRRVTSLSKGQDFNAELQNDELKQLNSVKLTSEISDISEANVFIITVETPVDENNIPNLHSLLKATESVGSILKSGDTVIFESTVYPGVTEDICIPLLEKTSRLKINEDFFCGFSPERISPGRNGKKLEEIVKVVSGSSENALDIIGGLYATVITAGIKKAKSIRVAEAAKITENIQRDVNIALMNELEGVFFEMGISMHDVIDAAKTKWNFLNFTPGFVGGHCICVDPLYLLSQAASLKHRPDLIEKARQINDSVPTKISERIAVTVTRDSKQKEPARIIIFGLTFKEDCADFRNSGAIKLAKTLNSMGNNVYVHDPYLDDSMDAQLNPFNVVRDIENLDEKFDTVVIAVPHSDYKASGFLKFNGMLKTSGQLFDIKGIFNE